MAIHKVTEVFIGGGLAMDPNNTSISALGSQLAIVGSDMTALNPAGGDTISTQPSIYLVNKNADGTLKRSFEVKGTNVVSYEANTYAPAQREVWAIGYNRKTATGSIAVNNDTLYKASIRFKNDKTFYSVRPEYFSISFQSSATATQSNIADQIVSIINNSAYGTGVNKQVKAVKVGNGTGVYGLTGATNFGVEIWGLDIANQFLNTTYRENYVYFSVQVDDTTGFASGTTCTQIQAVSYGTGTYYQAYNMENFAYGYEGVRNRRLWPIPTLAYLASASGVNSANIAAATATAVVNEDTIIFSAAVSTQLPPGSIITASGSTYEIKYYLNTTLGGVGTQTAVMTTTLPVLAGVNFTGRAFYDVVNIRVRDKVVSDGAVVTNEAEKDIFIFTPAIIAGSATSMTAAPSAEGQDIMDILNGWMATTPLAPANIAL
jgi:hypothetical protein